MFEGRKKGRIDVIVRKARKEEKKARKGENIQEGKKERLLVCWKE